MPSTEFESITVIIVNQRGLHARASAKFVEVAKQFPCEIKVGKSDASLADGKNILSVMMLAASVGSELVIYAKGEQQTQALEALDTLVRNGFDE